MGFLTVLYCLPEYGWVMLVLGFKCGWQAETAGSLRLPSRGCHLPFSPPLSLPAAPDLRTPGVLYNQFLSQVDFELLLAHARELGVLVFENSAKRLMVVTPAGHSDVKRFWKRQKHNS